MIFGIAASRWSRIVTVAALAAALTLFAAPRPALAAFSYLQPPFEQQDFLTDFPNDGHFGPTGLAFYPGGDILVADAADGNLYRFSKAGGPAGAPFVAGGTTLGLAFGRDGKLYAARRASASVVELDPSDGHVLGTIASGFSNLIGGLAVDPQSGDLFVTDQGGNRYGPAGGVFRVHPANGSVSVYSAGPLFGSADGLVFDSDGTLYVSNERGDGNVLRVDRQGSASVLVTLPGGPDGLAVGKPGTALAGSLFVNRNDGVISRIDLTQTPAMATTFASGGTRGDFVAVSPDGFLLATQTDRVVRFSPASFQPTADGGRSDLPLLVYSALVMAVLAVGTVIVGWSWHRRRALQRAQVEITAENPARAAAQPLPAVRRAAESPAETAGAGRLVQYESDGSTRVHQLAEAFTSLGSGRGCTVTLPGGAGVAPQHARIWSRGGRYGLHHVCGPRYRTIVAGQPVDWVDLESGDEIRIGPHRLVFEEEAFVAVKR